MLRLVFVDMDGTFLLPDKTVSAENLRILDRAYERGVQFVPCTGRNVTGLPPELVGHPCVRYAVCANGALICDVRTHEVLREAPIGRDVVLDLYERVRDLPITFDVFADGKVYTLADRWPLLDRLPFDERHMGQVKAVRTRFDGTGEELIAQVGSIARVNVFFLDESDARAVWAAVDESPALIRTSSLSCNVEITCPDAHKGAGMCWLCDHLGVSLRDVVAFGDSDNDLTMLEAAGDGVAMGNANDACRAVADHMTASCAESGVARYLAPLLA